MTTVTTGRTPRGIRNNNPGNIRRNADPWQGLAERQGDVEFFTFKDRQSMVFARWHARSLRTKTSTICVLSGRSSVGGRLLSKTTQTLMCVPWWLIRGWMLINRLTCIASIIFCRLPRRSSTMKMASSPIPMPNYKGTGIGWRGAGSAQVCRKPAPSKADRPRQPPRRAWAWSRLSSRHLIPPVTR
jgi:hypothetical protein